MAWIFKLGRFRTGNSDHPEKLGHGIPSQSIHFNLTHRSDFWICFSNLHFWLGILVSCTIARCHRLELGETANTNNESNRIDTCSKWLRWIKRLIACFWNCFSILRIRLLIFPLFSILIKTNEAFLYRKFEKLDWKLTKPINNFKKKKTMDKVGQEKWKICLVNVNFLFKKCRKKNSEEICQNATFS